MDNNLGPGLIIGMVIGVFGFFVVNMVMDNQKNINCAKHHNVFECKHVEFWVPVRENLNVTR